MDVIELMPRLRFVRFPAGHAYLWHDSDGLTAGPPADSRAAAIPQASAATS